jgi:hypothetical protein
VAHTPDPDRLVFEVWNEEGFLNYGFVDKTMFRVALDVPFGFKRQLATWVPWKYKVWGTKKDIRSLKLPDVRNSLDGALFVRPENAQQLCEGFEQSVELLPIDVEGAPWFLAHCFAARAVLDERRSDYSPPLVQHPWQRYWMVRRAVLQDDATLYSSFFCIQGRGASLYCGAAFRERVERMGLEGLRFKEIGYFHRPGDPEPPPPEPWFAPAKPIELPPPIWKATDLAGDQHTALQRASEDVRARMGLAVDAPDEAVLNALTQEITSLRKRYAKLDATECQRLLLGLSSLYGQLFVARMNWRWCKLTGPDGQHLLAVTTPDQSHFIAASVVIGSLLTQPKRAITLAIAFNMVRMGALPPSAPGALVQLNS